MRQSRLLARQAFNRQRRIEDFRRRAWAPRYVRRLSPPGDLNARSYIPGEFIPGEFVEPPEPTKLNALRRGIGLTSDLTLLTLLSPFFAIWFLYRGVLRLKRAAVRPKLRAKT